MSDVFDARIRAALLAAGSALILYFFYRVSSILPPFILGTILAYLVNPFINYMKRRNFTRRGALIFLLLIILNVLLLSGLVLFPLLLREIESLTEMLPAYINSIEEIIDYFNREYRQIQLPGMVEDSINRFLEQMEEYLINFLQRITEGILNSLYLLFTLLLTPIISYYLLRDIESLRKTARKIVPVDKKNFLSHFAREIDKIFMGYLRAQIWISLIVGLLAGAGLFFLNVRFYILLGLLAGISNMVPYFGPIIGGVPAALIALLSSPAKMLGVILLYAVLQQVESVLIAPRIMSGNVGLHPVTIIFSLLAGTELFGIWGLLFAVPLAGSLKVFISLVVGRTTAGRA
ncbi:MAG: AI-2E family transporter [Halanaerobiaceae bacterium]